MDNTFSYKEKQRIDVPPSVEPNTFQLLWHGIVGIFLVPIYVIAAGVLGAPGINIHIKCALIGFRLFLTRRTSIRQAYILIFFPMDSTRYFEFDEVLKSLERVDFSKYLDVSSPRMGPLLLLMRNKTAQSQLLNPDSKDLEETKGLAQALGLSNRCAYKSSTIDKAGYKPETFDLITCISVLEHIPEDKKAVEVMWSLLRSGGRLILTLPCMAQSLEQYISNNQYGILSAGSDGYTFWQRFYDEERLCSVIFNITGQPQKTVVYGERSAGLFLKNASSKRSLGLLYPFWRESYMMGKEYSYFQSVAQLPGEGVVMLEFKKT